MLSRGNKRQAFFLSDNDRCTFLSTLGRMSERFEVDIIVFVLMDNHYHLLSRTNRPNLSKSMQWLAPTKPLFSFCVIHRKDINFSNSEIGSQIGLTVSSVSRRDEIFQTLLGRDKKILTECEKFKSIVKV